MTRVPELPLAHNVMPRPPQCDCGQKMNRAVRADILRPHESLQLVRNIARPQEKSGIKILSLGSWLEGLPTVDLRLVAPAGAID
jgi:hypothetical protein